MRTYKITFSPNKFQGELVWIGNATSSELAISALMKTWFNSCHRSGLNIRNADIQEIHKEYVSWHPSMNFKD